MNYMYFLIAIIVTMTPRISNAQSWVQLENEYNNLLKNKLNDLAVIKAKEMYNYIKTNESDTCIQLPISMKYIGNSFINVDSAIFYYDLALNTLKKQKRENHIQSAKIHYNKSNIYNKIGDKNLSFFESEQAIIILSNLNYPEYPFCIWPLINLGTLHRESKNYSSSIKFFQKCLDLTGKHEGISSENYVASLYRIGNINWECTNYDSATFILKKAIFIENKLENIEDSVKYKNILLTAKLFQSKGFYEDALFLYLQAEDYSKKINGVNNIQYANILGTIGNVYRELKRYNEAEDYYSKSSNIFITKKEDIDQGNYAIQLLNFGLNNFYRGNYKNAEINFKTSLNIFETFFGEYDERYLSSLNNIAGVYATIGLYDKAQYYFEKALKLNKHKYGENHIEFANTSHNLAFVYHNNGNDSLAIIHIKKAAPVRKNILGENSIEYASSLSILGYIYLDNREYKLSDSCFITAFNIYKKMFGERSPACASELYSMGLLNLVQGNYDKGQEYLEKSLKIDTSNIVCEKELAKLYSRIQKFNSADSLYKSVFEKKLKEIERNFRWLSQKEKEEFWNLDEYFYLDINSFSVHSFIEIPASTQISYNANLVSKSLLLETSTEMNKILSELSDKEMKLQFEELKQLRRLYSKMQSEGSDKKEIMDQYKFQADSLDKILVNKLGEYAESKRKFEIKWKDVQANLTSSEAAIEFARYYDYADSIYKYMALVVRPEYEYPKLVKLGSESNIKSSCSQREFSDLYNYVWRGIDSLLSGVKTIYYSPVGELNNVSFSALISENKINNQLDSAKSNWSYLMDHYELHQLTTTRYLADGTLKKNKEMRLSIKLIGGVNYTDLPILNDTINKEESNEDFALQLNLQKELNENRSKRGGKINYLKGSEIEVKDISKVLKAANWIISSSTGKNADEYQFKEELNKTSPGVLHIATHGFAFPEKEIKKDKEFPTPENTSYKISEDPMVRCGLMFSGANISWSGDSKKMIETTGDDGILTASEVANLDLSNTKLVVLSACETGLGKIESSEGTFGLKRGFKLAGVEQIIVSLWSVPDKETMELMTLFYSELSKTKDPVISFNKAQKEMRNRYPYDPEKWAGFVLVR